MITNILPPFYGSQCIYYISASVNVLLTDLLLDINVPVVTCHASKQSSKMAQDGDYTPSRLNALMYQRLVARNTYVLRLMMLMTIKPGFHYPS